MSTTTHFRISSHKHEKMKQLSKMSGETLIQTYEKAIDHYIELKTQENIVMDSNLEVFINNRISKAEDHLASMLGRTGMDTSMVLTGLVLLLENIMKNVSKEEIYHKLRKDGANYFSNAIRKDKEYKENRNKRD